MSDEHARWADFAGAYVLGAMADGEREAYERHLATCATCREEVEELRPAAEALPMASPQLAAPPQLKDRIMAEVEREAALLRAAGEPEPPPRRRRRRVVSWLGPLVPVAAAMAIVAVLLVGGDTQTYEFDRAGARLEVEGDRATLVAENLPAPPEGRVYEVWVTPKGSEDPQPTDVLFLPRGDGSAVAAVPGSADDIGQVLVTDEPPGGSDVPTGELLMAAELS